MTSEVLIMTPSAIAMAADSVVTVNNNKTYEGVNKLFMLSNNPPMGIMIYNNANFFNFPMETIIKDFKNNNLEKCNTVESIKNQFEEYLNKICSSNNQLFYIPIEKEIDFFIQEVKKDFKKNGNNLSQFNMNNIDVDIDEYTKKINHTHFNDYFDSKVKEITTDVHEIDLLKKIFFETKLNTQFTGVVIAGFNQEDLFPSSISFRIVLVNNTFIIDCVEKHSVNKKTTVVLTPFAQINTITTFLNGIDEPTSFQIISYFNEIIKIYSNKLIEVIQNNNILDSEKSAKLEEILTEKNEICTNFSEFINKLKEENHIPIIKSIESLPKEELANLAESLINITSLKLKVQDYLETVGGDVDVAIITKGDGFIWTKRKHYFDKYLNPQFFDRK